jgi:C4-dicarboxylate-specific signal transduction histidine kinase
MATGSNEAELTGIQFFGKMSASISHEIKNALAVINENAGLLEDICFMEDRGKPIDTTRLKKIAGDVKDQVRRADRITTAMSRFAHSADELATATDLGELTALLGLLAMRFGALRGVTIRTHAPSAPVLVTTFPFGLLNLLWTCLDCAMTAAGSGKTVELVAEKTTGGGLVRFRRLEQLGAASVADLALGRLSALPRMLNATITADDTNTELVVRLPQSPRV